MCSICEGEAGFYSLIVRAEVTDRALMEVALRAAKGQGDDGEVKQACKGVLLVVLAHQLKDGSDRDRVASV